MLAGLFAFTDGEGIPAYYRYGSHCWRGVACAETTRRCSWPSR